MRARDDVKAIVLGCAGQTFIAGADIKEFDTGIGAARLSRGVPPDRGSPCRSSRPSTARRSAPAPRSRWPVTIASPPTAQAWACRSCRSASSGRRRHAAHAAPHRLADAADMMLSGRPMPAPQGKELGLIDEIVERRPHRRRRHVREATARAGQGPAPHARAAGTRRRERDADARGRRAQAAKIMRGRNSPARDCSRRCRRRPRSRSTQGSTSRRAISSELEQSLESRALRHLFFAEREARKIPGLPEGTTPRRSAASAIVGAGTMGGGIAMVFANAGIPVTLLDVEPGALERARQDQQELRALGVARQPAGRPDGRQRMRADHSRRSTTTALARRRPRRSRPCSRTWRSRRRSSRSSTRREAGRDPGDQHLDPGHRRDRRGHQAPAGRHRPALLQPRQRDAAAGNRARGEDRRRRARHRARSGKDIGKSRCRVEGLLRLHRQPHDGPLRARGRALLLEGATPQAGRPRARRLRHGHGHLAVYDMAGLDVGT